MLLIETKRNTVKSIYKCNGYSLRKYIVSFSSKSLMILMAILIIGSAISAECFASETEREYVNMTCSEASVRLVPARQGSDAQGNDVFQSTKGKWVKWTGTLTTMNETLWGMEVIIKCGEDSRTADATISFEDSWKVQLEQFKAGEQIQFAGRIEDYSELGGFLIKGGEFISNEVRNAQLTSLVGQLPETNDQKAISSANESVQSPSLSIGDEFVVEHSNLTNPKRCYVTVKVPGS